MVLGVAVMAVFLVVALPVWLPAMLLVDVARQNWRFPLVRFTAFGLLWAWLETFGILGAVALWAVGQSRNQNANYALQKLWTRGVVGALGVTVGLRIEVEGADELVKEPDNAEPVPGSSGQDTGGGGGNQTSKINIGSKT
jgi:hypothetical protein